MNEDEFLLSIARDPLNLDLLRDYAAFLETRHDERAEYLRLTLHQRQLQESLRDLELELKSRESQLDLDWVDRVLLLIIRCPTIGTAYLAPSPDAPPYVQVGQMVTPQTVVILVEAMKVFNEITATMSGVITEILVRNGEPVDVDKPLFALRRYRDFEEF